MTRTEVGEVLMAHWVIIRVRAGALTIAGTCEVVVGK